MKLKLKITKSLKPNSSCVDEITLEGNTVIVKMKNSNTLYHYNADSSSKNAIISIQDGMSAGKIYNQFFRGKSVAKTVFYS